MSVQCCPLSAHDGDAPSCSRTMKRTARKEHQCYECREVIPIGAIYEYASGVWDRQPSSYKTCLSCVEIRNHFACDGWLFGQVWQDIRDNFFPDMKAGGPCMKGLSPEAKGRLFDLRMKWLVEQHS